MLGEPYGDAYQAAHEVPYYSMEYDMQQAALRYGTHDAKGAITIGPCLRYEALLITSGCDPALTRDPVQIVR